MFKRIVVTGLALVALALAPRPALAWNCSDPLASRVDVGPTNPGGSPGDGDGQWYKGNDAANPNDYYVCQVPTKPTTGTGSQTQNQTQNQTATGGAGGNSSSNSTSGANSSATGGNSNATGGNSNSSSGVSNSGNSSSNSQGGSVSGSGNSTNKNTNNNTATGGQGGAGGQGGSGGQSSSSATGGNQSQSSTSSAADNGNGSNNTTTNSTTNVEAAPIPVSTAYAPTSIPTVPCFKGYSGGVQTQSVGISLGGGKIDEGCDQREIARSYALLGSKLAACKVMVSNKRSLKAGVTLDDCMRLEVVTPTPVVAAPAPAPEPVIPNIIINNRFPEQVAPVVPAPEVVATPSRELIGICTFASIQAICQQPGKPDEIVPIKPLSYNNPTRVTSICKTMLDEAARRMKEDPKLRLFIIGNQNMSETASIVAVSRANEARLYLVNHDGVNSAHINTTIGSGKDRTVELWIGTE